MARLPHVLLVGGDSDWVGRLFASLLLRALTEEPEGDRQVGYERAQGRQLRDDVALAVRGAAAVPAAGTPSLVSSRRVSNPSSVSIRATSLATSKHVVSG
jgi:hypothetical protein